MVATDERDEGIEASLRVFRRGAVDLIEEGELRRKLERAFAGGGRLRVKLGLDPSSPDLHVGHSIPLRKLRDLQELGHQIVLIVGEATAMVGDPSGRSKLRPQLTRDEVRANMQTYIEQASLVLDMERVEIRYNTEWFDAMSFEDVMRLASRMTVAQMIQRDIFQTRMQAEEPIGIHEFLYPLMQGWDSVMVRADVELGGTDQLFNLLVGRDLQEKEGQERQVVLTTPLINGLDGRKMSKSYGNAIGLNDAPDDMFGKVMSLADEAMETWFVNLTRLDDDEVAGLLAGHPREAKARLAHEITAFYHGVNAAEAAGKAFDRRFRDKELPNDIPEKTYAGDWPVPLSALLRELGLTSSSSEARRLIEQGGVRVDEEVVSDPKRMIDEPAETLLIQVGKRRFARVVRPG
ncbi:MAG: tyrosine--tRNA ligase [Planctomycetota bacterium]|nr:tyrosine--tRNA ligase [Planctomycetota bacterium]